MTNNPTRPNATQTDHSGCSTHTPNGKDLDQRRKLHRCVSMCTTDTESNIEGSDNSSNSSVNNNVSSIPNLSRKRQRFDSTPELDTIIETECNPTTRTFPCQGQQRNMDNLDSSASVSTSCISMEMNNKRSNSMANRASIRKKQRQKEAIRALNDSDPNIAYTPYIPIPASPVRSVVSCDMDIGDTSVRDDIINGACVQEKETGELESQPPQIQLQLQMQGEDDLEQTKSESKVTAKEEDQKQRDQDQQQPENEDELLLKEMEHLPEELQIHVKSLCIEASLTPMKLLLHRLLTHQTYNRKGWFNVPVNPVALGLKDYTTIIKCPMDLGTIKKSLLTNVYHSHAEVARDIRLVFRNACLYNPPLHAVHEAAKDLRDYFEDAYAIILSKSANTKTIQSQLTQPSSTFAAKKIVNPYALPPIKHTCKSCLGRECIMCRKGCLSLEPSLLICAGSACSGSKIRRGINYYCTLDGTKTWCQKCYPSLPAQIPFDDGDDTNSATLYKKDLLKRRNEEDIVERWIDCTKCGSGVHEMCAFVNEFCTDRDTFVCPMCTHSVLPKHVYEEVCDKDEKLVYSFLSGTDEPERIKDITNGTLFNARGLPLCNIAHFIETKVKVRMLDLNCPVGAQETLTVRVISDCQKEFNVPAVILQHFRMKQRQNSVDSMKGVHTFHEPSSSVEYRSKAIALFQRIDGIDVCIFCMYVQEYDMLNEDDSIELSQHKRVYLAYIDSVEHFRPRTLRTHVYHEILTAYFASARARGFENIHIWSCPPSRGNSFVFWGHPSSQRTPTKEHLLSWYHNALSHAVDQGVITDVKSLYEHSFEQFDKSVDRMANTSQRSTMICPPLLEGDFWIEEATRIQVSSISRWFKAKKATDEKNSQEINKSFCPEMVFAGEHSRCPVIQVARLIEDCIMEHSLASPFLRPVNAAALNLHDYHTIITKPMDLGTVLAQCLLGDYATFRDLISDLELIFTNAMRYNPKGHTIHSMAKDLWEFALKEMLVLVKYWRKCGINAAVGNGDVEVTMKMFDALSMRLSTVISESTKSPVLEPDVVESASIALGSGADNINGVDRYKLLFSGPEGIAKLMVGNDVWLLDPRHSHKDTLKKKKKNGKNKEIAMESQSSDCSRRYESWLNDEVLTTVRNLRAGIFVCRLKPKPGMSCAEVEKENDFLEYIKGFDLKSHPIPSKSRNHMVTPGVCETRHGLLEFSQYSNLQFDSVRRAKYSTAMLLYYLRCPESTGIIPCCSSCDRNIENVRFQRINKAFDERRRNSQSIRIRMTCVDMSRRDVCEQCFSKIEKKKKEDYVPIRLSFRQRTYN